MMETARIRRAGYPIRHNYREFVDRFRCLAKGASTKDLKHIARTICVNFLAHDSMDYQFGKTKVFLKEENELLLEQKRSFVLAQSIVIIQKNIRTWIARRR